ncbi:MAG: hypothetical protein QP876_01320 [Enterococcus faecalis]|nr:hypothetical protein [Enterococcus faecalis]
MAIKKMKSGSYKVEVFYPKEVEKFWVLLHSDTEKRSLPKMKIW